MSALHDGIEGQAGTHKESPLFRNRDFLLLWSGQIVSFVGTQVSMVAFPLLVLAVTHSPAQAGVLGALRTVPFLVLTLPAGALVDRWDRKRLMIISDTGRAVALGSVPLALTTGHLSFALLATVSLVEGTLYTAFNVAESACLPQVVGKEQISNALSLGSTTDSVSQLIGPALAGALFAAGRALPFLVDAVSYAASVISLLFIKRDFQEERAMSSSSLMDEVRMGMAWLWQHSVLRFLALLIGVLNVFSMGYPLILIVRAQELHATPLVVGLLFASGGIGGIAGSLVAAPLQRRFTVGQIVIGAAWIWAITWAPYALAPTIPTFALANVIGWLIIPIMMVTHYSYRLTVVPDHLQGRVNSVFKLVAYGGEPLALALTGVLLQTLGAVETIFIISVPQIAVSIAATLYRPLREAPSLTELSSR